MCLLQAFLIFGGVVFSVTLAANCYLWTKRGLMMGVKEEEEEEEAKDLEQNSNNNNNNNEKTKEELCK